MLLSVSNVRKTILYCKRNGLKSSIYATMERIEQRKQQPYSYQAPSIEELEYQSAQSFEYEPLISIVVPCYETKPVFLEDLIHSVEEQSYKNFELILADASKSKVVFKVASELIELYGDNVIYKKLEDNQGISGNTNQALNFANGDYIALLDHDDVLTADALYEMVKALNIYKSKGMDPVLIYSDEDKTDGYLDTFYEPNFKLKFNLDLIMTNNYICHLSLFRADVIKKLGLRKKYDGAQDYDLVLRTILFIKDNYGKDYDKYIFHVPKVLYHWRCHDESTAANPASKDYAYENGRLALENFVNSCGWRAKVSHLKHVGFYKVHYEDGVFSEREEIGIVGGPIYKKNKMISGPINGKGKVIYENLRNGYSGYLHRAVLKQIVTAVDIRNMDIREELLPTFEKVTKMSYTSFKQKVNELSQEDCIRYGLILGNEIAKEGYKVLYDPDMTMFLD